MTVAKAVYDMKLWMILGIVCAFIIGPVGDISSSVLVIVLIIQMTISMDGLSFSAESIKNNKRPVLFSVLACFGISTAVTLLVGLFFITYRPEIWNGWVILAAVPCAVSVVTMSFLVRGNTTMCVLSLAAIYIIALLLTPLIILALIGESVSIIRVFLYVLLFVAVPMAASVPMKKVKIGRNIRVVSINIMIFAMAVLSLGQNREYIFSEPWTAVLVILACFIRIFAVGFVMLYILKKCGSSRDNSMVYIPMAVWKNSGLGIALCLAAVGTASETALPCAISMLIEMLWFAVVTNRIEKSWPVSRDTSVSVNG
ncbi:MAG: Na+-dependent transporter [Candidatus Methanoplasma sp.]|nr:Na+-dependent transporter [Candidatus Methanoplasma sp.]